MSEDAVRASADEAILWHDVECASYSADLGLWERLAASCGGEVLDLGCGTGRVGLHLARRGHTVTGIDSDPALVAELNRRAGEAALTARAELGDARDFDLGRRFRLVLAPMQLLQLLADGAERRSCLTCANRHLSPGGRLAAAILAPDGGVEAGEEGAPIPDVREERGWVYSSLPVAVRGDRDQILIRRLRQRVSPDGALCEHESEVILAHLPATVLESEGAAVGLASAGRCAVAPTEDHVGSTVVLMEAH
ncbi:MAG: class I SAM-dependent methyltransferase [Solirubrobacterales bacterium]